MSVRLNIKWFAARFTAFVYLTVVVVTVIGFWSLLSDLNQFDTGMEAAKVGDYQGAMEYWLPLAEKGNPEAQYNLGVIYEEGRGVAVDLEMAAVWYRKAAEQGMRLAQVNLGLLYAKGAGVENDPELAAEWFLKAADRGSPEAEHNLGNMYLQGLGVEQSYETAAKWFRRAALQGNHRAQFRLGMLYHQGLGVAENTIEAAAWVALASSAEDSVGARARDALNQINSHLTPQQRGEAAKRKEDLLQTLTEKIANKSR